MDLLTGYHHVFWVGDLNYRLDWGSQATNPTESPSQADFDEIVAKVYFQSLARSRAFLNSNKYIF